MNFQMGALIPMNFSDHRGKEDIMRFLSFFSIVAFLGIAFFVSAEFPVKTNSDAVYSHLPC